MSNPWSSTYGLSEWVEWQDKTKEMAAKQRSKCAELLTFLSNMYKDGLYKVYLHEEDIRDLEEYVYSTRPPIHEIAMFGSSVVVDSSSDEGAIGCYKLHLYIYRLQE